MRQPLKAVLGTVLAAALAVTTASCGSDSAAKGKPATDKPAPWPKIVVKSSAMVGERIPARYTCDGQDVSPPLEWGAVPADVHQLAVFLVGFRPKPGTKTYKLSVEWAAAGVSPRLHRLAAGSLPTGAYLASDKSGERQRYSLCPAKGTSVHYQFELYGVPSVVRIPPQFSGPAVLNALTRASGATRANAHGGFVAIYSRA
ncbi:MAG: phospholipid-binding protein family [Solirubrobacterales bacterium]|nr:phospholipid-binding protein family [Solirubrobacterales bacterium]